jgi:hypothetical protein
VGDIAEGPATVTSVLRENGLKRMLDGFMRKGHSVITLPFCTKSNVFSENTFIGRAVPVANPAVG